MELTEKQKQEYLNRYHKFIVGKENCTLGCPYCNSDAILADNPEDIDGEIFIAITCVECHTKWWEVHTLDRIEPYILSYQDTHSYTRNAHSSVGGELP